MIRLTRVRERVVRARLKHPFDTQDKLSKRLDMLPQNVSRILTNDKVKERIKELMDQSPKLQLPSLLQKLEEGLEADETKFFAHEGEVTDERTTVDYVTRKGYLETALELHGVKDKGGGNVTNNYFTPEAFRDFIAAYVEGTQKRAAEVIDADIALPLVPPAAPPVDDNRARE